MLKTKDNFSKFQCREPFGIAHHGVIPGIKLREPDTYGPGEITGHDVSVIRIHDLVSSNGTKTNDYFEAICNAGGLQEYFGNGGKYILSSIAPDKVLAGLTPSLFLEIIKEIKADWYLTPDAETYCKDEWDIRTAEKEIEKILEETEWLLKSKVAQPIGLIKGSTIEQVRYHAQSLRNLGISVFAFHTSDFLLHNNRSELDIGTKFFSEARKEVPYLIAYGIGSRSSMKLFQAADLFVTQSHFAQAFRHYGYMNGREYRLANHVPISREIIMANLKDICTSALSFGKGQSTLSQWVYKNISVQSNTCDYCPQKQFCAISQGAS